MSEQTIISDGSLENMYRLFHLDQPRGSLADFQKWFAALQELQESVKPCPWCEGQPALRVIPGLSHSLDNYLYFTVICEGESCPVHPSLDECFDTPEEAVKEWNHGLLDVSLPYILE